MRLDICMLLRLLWRSHIQLLPVMFLEEEDTAAMNG